MPKPPHPENDYFGRIDITKRKKIAEEKQEKLSERQKKKLHNSHWRKCSECGCDMTSVSFRGTTIFKCENCGGAFLHSEVLQKLCGEDTHFIDSLFEIFGLKKE